MRAEDFNNIALLAVDVSHINHAHIHTYISNVRRPLAVYNAIALSVAKAAVKAVGISNGQCGNARIAFQCALAAVAHCLIGRHVAHLQDYGLKC